MRENKPYFNKSCLPILISLIWLGSYQFSFSQDNIIPVNEPTKSGTNQVSVPLQGRAIIINVSSDKLDYLYEKKEFIATGSAEVIIKEQNSKLEADKITYDQNNQLIIAEDNVKITKNGNVVFGSYAKIYLDRESALINDPTTFISGVKIRSKTATTIPGQLEAFNGTAIIDTIPNVSPNKASTSEYKEWLTNQGKLADNGTLPKQTTKIVSQEIDIDCLPDRNVITLKNSTIYAKQFKIAKIAKMVFTTNKDVKNIETMLPEIGQNPSMGAYLGPSHVFYLPQGRTLKISPLASFSTRSDANLIGGGAMARYMSETNQTELGFTTNRNKVLLKGEQKITPNTKLVYGSNAYSENGFFGQCITEYIAEVVDERKLGSMMNFDFNLRSSAGYSQDYYSNMGTMKFQLQGSLVNPEPLYAFRKDLFQVRTYTQGNISVYGTGDTYGFIGAGPWLSSRIGRLTVNGAYVQSAIYGSSPFLYDQYLPGKSNVILNPELKVSKYLNIGNYGSYNLLKDNWEKKLFAMNLFYAKIGPEDIKFVVGYDLSRKLSKVSVEFQPGKGGRTAIDFDKLKVTQPNKD